MRTLCTLYWVACLTTMNNVVDVLTSELSQPLNIDRVQQILIAAEQRILRADSVAHLSPARVHMATLRGRRSMPKVFTGNCYKCGKLGHVMRDCPEQQQPPAMKIFKAVRRPAATTSVALAF